MSKNLPHKTVIKPSIAEVNQTHWQSVVQNRNIYLSLPYLQSLEKGVRGAIEMLYVLVYDAQKRPVVAGVFQLVTFGFKQKSKPNPLLKHLLDERDDNGHFSLKMLICGNAFATGENGFLWSDDIPRETAFKAMAKAAQQIKKDERLGQKMSVILFKEFWPESLKYSDTLKNHKFKDFRLDVNMVLAIRPEWKSLDDYLQSLKTKYRTKAKRAYDKSKSLVLKSLSADEIEQHQTRIDELFHNVIDRSDYNFPSDYSRAFPFLKKELGAAFSLCAVFKEEKLIGFSTAILNGKTMEANYVGMDYDYNFEYAVYERLLYDYVEQAIAKGASELHLGRTSELIKSALGAVPVEMKLYAKHKAPLTNLFLSKVLGCISPSPFELRKPFKVDFPAASLAS